MNQNISQALNRADYDCTRNDKQKNVEDENIELMIQKDFVYLCSSFDSSMNKNDV